MSIIENVFYLIKREKIILGSIQEYKIKISESNNFEKENLIGIYKIRKCIAERDHNHNLVHDMNTFIFNLNNYSGNKLRLVSILGEKYYGVFYLSWNYEKVIGSFEREINENEFDKLIKYL